MAAELTCCSRSHVGLNPGACTSMTASLTSSDDNSKLVFEPTHLLSHYMFLELDFAYDIDFPKATNEMVAQNGLRTSR